MMIFWLTCLVGYPRTSAPEPKVLWIATAHTSSDEKAINEFIDEHNLDAQKWCITKMDALDIYKEQVLEFKQ